VQGGKIGEARENRDRNQSQLDPTELIGELEGDLDSQENSQHKKRGNELYMASIVLKGEPKKLTAPDIRLLNYSTSKKKGIRWQKCSRGLRLGLKGQDWGL